MHKLMMLAVLPLAACASVEERTDARSGEGFTSTTIENQIDTSGVTEVSMQGLEAVPATQVSGGATTQADAADVALSASANSGAWTQIVIGADTFALRHVTADGFDFAVADPQTKGGKISPTLVSQSEMRTGCLPTGQTYEDDGRIAIALDCS